MGHPRTFPGSYLIALFFLSPLHVPGRTLFVDLNSPMPVAPYSDWVTAAETIQDAVDNARPGDLILVTNGVYQKGGRPIFGRTMNRVALTCPVTVQSVNGPSFTEIRGYQVPGITNADSSARCAYVTNGSVLAGFTLTAGATRAIGSPMDQAGGGVWCEAGSAVISNCWILGNRSHGIGGGVFQGDVKNCLLRANAAFEKGGGAYEAILQNCVLTENSARDSGGGAYYCKLTNCTVALNVAQASGGGVDSSTLNNCIVYNNHAPDQSNWVLSLMNYCCTQPMPRGIANITNDPRFLKPAAGDFRLDPNSPCINSGLNSGNIGALDLDGNPRVTLDHHFES
jgi:hypothetical protein